MKRKAVAPGVYIDSDGRFWCRPTVNGRRTNRLLKATQKRAAIEEFNREKFKSGKDPFFALADKYLEAGCPDRHFNERTEDFLRGERRRVVHLVKFFGNMQIDEIRPMQCPAYKKWRLPTITKGTGLRTVDMELITLSNVLTYGVITEHIQINVMKFARPVFHRPDTVRRSKEVAAASGDQVHALAKFLFTEGRTMTLGWELLFAAYTGCRTSELRRLRMDAKSPNEAGFIMGGYLFLGRRSKRGVNPWVPIVGPFADMLNHFLEWRKSLDVKTPFFFPASNGVDGVVDQTSLNRAMDKAVKALGFQHITPHGLRAFYVTLRRSWGISDIQIAAEIGDSNPQMIPQSYGNLPANWNGGERLSFLPKDGVPAWDLMALYGNSGDSEPSKNDSQVIDEELLAWQSIS